MVDFSATINQSACDKLLSSTSYPLIVVDRNEPFPGCGGLTAEAYRENARYEYSSTEIADMFRECVPFVRDERNDDTSILPDVYSLGGRLIQQARAALDAAKTSDTYEGPPQGVLEKIVAGGIEALPQTMGALSRKKHLKLYAWCPTLRVTIRDKPSLTLQSPRIDLNGLRVEVRATGELWASYPWLACYKWCTHWEVVQKCDRIGSITVSPKIAVDAHADFVASGPQVYCSPKFDKLRLDYDILRDIPLEVIANVFLKNKKFAVFDGAKLVETVPIMGSKFAVDSIGLPANPHGLTVDVIVRQI